ncbi:MAG: hypothetical protein IK113_03260 [Bacteroidales bacterium]|nr:hypothetical protein [Bacteroidales bacterium]
MRKIEFVPVILTDVTDIFTIRIDNDTLTEFHKFLIMFKDTTNPYLKDDLFRIESAIKQIAQNGALESLFRPEGKMSDRVCAMPLLIKSRSKTIGTLRLYCIRISDKLLILGGGGLKTTDSYEQDDFLNKKVEDLQSIDIEIANLEKRTIIEDAIYNITIEID